MAAKEEKTKNAKAIKKNKSSSMKVTVTKEVEVQIEFPAYYEWGECFYKITSGQSFIEVITGDKEYSIRAKSAYSTDYVGQIITRGKPSTKEDFARAFEQVFNKLEHEQAKIDPSHRFNQLPEEENGLEESERNEEQVNEHFEIELSNQE